MNNQVKEFHIGDTFKGVYPPDAAVWCNENNCFIDVVGDKEYEIKEVVHTDEEYMESIRFIRNSYLNQYIDHINYLWYSSLSANEQNKLAKYRQYLLDIPQSEYFPYTDADKSEIIRVLDYKEWSAKNE